MVKAEPFLLWVVAGDQTAQRRVDELLPARKAGIDLVTCDAVQPYRERKVYLLNGPHTTMAQVARLAGFETVGQVMGDKTMRSFITREMEEEGCGLPKRIILALSCLVWIYGGKAGDAVKIQDDQKVVDAFRVAAGQDDFVDRILADAAIWGRDLTRIAGLAEAVQKNLDDLADRGIQPLIDRLA